MKTKNSVVLMGMICCGLIFSPAIVHAEENMQELKAQIQQLQERVEQLESRNNTQPQSGTPGGFFNAPQQRSVWDPFEQMRRMQEEMDRMFRHSFDQNGFSQGAFSNNLSFDYDIDFQETDDGYKIQIDMTGLDKDKVDIDINAHSITVKGEHSRTDKEENPNGYFQSQSYGSFMKTIPLPVDADTTQVKTEKSGDYLVITMPKTTS